MTRSRVGGIKSAIGRAAGKGIALRHLKSQPVRENAARVDQRRGAVPQSLGIQFAGQETVRLEPQRRTVK